MIVVLVPGNENMWLLLLGAQGAVIVHMTVMQLPQLEIPESTGNLKAGPLTTEKEVAAKTMVAPNTRMILHQDENLIENGNGTVNQIVHHQRRVRMKDVKNTVEIGIVSTVVHHIATAMNLILIKVRLGTGMNHAGKKLMVGLTKRNGMNGSSRSVHGNTTIIQLWGRRRILTVIVVVVDGNIHILSRTKDQIGMVNQKKIWSLAHATNWPEGSVIESGMTTQCSDGSTKAISQCFNATVVMDPPQE